MKEKMDQNTGDSSDAYQAKGNVTVQKNYGMDYKNVKQLCLDLIHDNFPKLQEQAMEKVNENVLAFAAELKAELDKKADVIDPEKLAEPDVQATLNEAVQGAAKKGNKADLNLLANLISSRIERGNNDILDITIDETVKLIPKITKRHINFLSLKHFVHRMLINKPDTSFQDIECSAKPMLDFICEDCEITISNKQYLAGLGILIFDSLSSGPIFDHLHRSYESLAPSTKEFSCNLEKLAPSMFKLAELYEKNRLSFITLNSFGEAIALANIGRILGGELELKTWIN